jgi:spore coat protein A, manganese oxidase
MAFTRKEFLKLGLLGGAGIALSSGAASARRRAGATTGYLLRSKARLPEPFTIPLRVPPVLEPVRTDDGIDYYHMTQKPGRAEILPGLKTEVWGYDGIFPGPTIESRSARKIVVRQHNGLPVPVSTHLHGGRTPPHSDGYPTDLVVPKKKIADRSTGGPTMGGSEHFKDYTYPLEQRAATLWYHDHRMGFTGPQVWCGLAGFHIVRDEEEDALPLPKGEKDVPLMLSDRSFGEGGSFLYPSLDPSLHGKPGVRGDYMEGVLGDVILVNGVPWPFMEVSNTRYRFRILNASNARRYGLALVPGPSDGPPFLQVGSDGGLLGAPIPHRTIPIAQAERFDVVIDFSRYPLGTKLTLVNRLGNGTTSRIMRFHVVRKEKEECAVPERLSEMGAFEALGASSARHTRKFAFARTRRNGHLVWAINGEVFSPSRIDARPRLGSTEVWELGTDAHHPVHLHLAHFKVLSRNGRRPLPTDAGWKDTVDLRPGELARVAPRFVGYRGRYVFHCHNLEHEDMMMMANFEVV